MGRREMREHIFKLLFMQEFNTPEEMPEQVQLYFETLEELSPAEEAYMQDKYAKILEQQDVIDEELNQISSGWKVSRMSKVDLNILRLAVLLPVFHYPAPEYTGSHLSHQIHKAL